ncbi:MAG: ATP-binding protein [Thermoplasmata archaeon]|nr:ATP-binding protein [Thermoplasmata archaeon]
MSDDIDTITFTDLSKFRKKKQVPPFPIVGIVGQHIMKKTMLLLASNPSMGNIIIIGEAGIGKSTAARGLRDILPEVECVNGCFYNCDPKDKNNLCQDCKSSVAELNSFGKRVPLHELPIGASERRIFGGFDSQSRLKPGFVGLANRGYLILARVNLLDHDILNRILDISESGIYKSSSDRGDFVHPAKFNVIATMNPEDGELDQEVLERFSLVVNIQSIKDIEERIEIVRRVEAYRLNADDFIIRNRREMEAFAQRVKRARDLVNRVDMPKKVQDAMDNILKKVGQENDRARNALSQATLANTAFNDRVWSTVDDVAEVADTVLGHREREQE